MNICVDCGEITNEWTCPVCGSDFVVSTKDYYGESFIDNGIDEEIEDE